MSEYICTKCEYVGKRRSKRRGSTAIEIFLWTVLLVPGPFYTIWRLLSKIHSCPQCGEDVMIEADSLLGQRRLKQIESEFSHEGLEKMPDMWMKDRLREESKRESGKVFDILGEILRPVFGAKGWGNKKPEENTRKDEW